MSEVIVRLCGCRQDFVPAGDQFDEARREKMRSRNCPACGRKKNLADNRLAIPAQPGKKKIPKGQEVKSLPVGTLVVLRLEADGWHAHLQSHGVTVESVSAGAMGILTKVARKYLHALGAPVTGKVHA